MTHTVTNSGDNITLELSFEEFTIITTICDMILSKSERAGVKKPECVENISVGITKAALDLALSKLTADILNDKE